MRFPSAFNLLDTNKLALQHGESDTYNEDLEVDVVGIDELCPGKHAPAFASRWGQEKFARVGQVTSDSGKWHVAIGGVWFLSRGGGLER